MIRYVHNPRHGNGRWCAGRTARAFVVVGVLAYSAFGAQPGDRAVRIDPGTADLSPNALSQRILLDEPRRFAGFEELYALPPDSSLGVSGRGVRAPGTPSEPLFARVDGGVVAVFPRSVYLPTRRGEVPAIPPGTVFHIGSPEQILGLDEPASRRSGVASPNRIDTRAANVARAPGSVGTGERDAQHGASWADESYRRRRVSTLLEIARRADAGVPRR